MNDAAYALSCPDANFDDAAAGTLAVAPRSRSVHGDRPTRIMIASAQPIVREGLRSLLTAEAGLDVVAEADCCASAVALVRRLCPDVIVIDLELSDLDGLTAIHMVRLNTTHTRVIALVGANDEARALASMRAGASAYLSKLTPIEGIVRTIRDVRAGFFMIPSNLVGQLSRIRAEPADLSARESDVLRMVARGQPNKQIARELGIAPSTVKTHVGSLLSKLGLGSRTQLALHAARIGMVAFDSERATTRQTEPSGCREASQSSVWSVHCGPWSAVTQA